MSSMPWKPERPAKNWRTHWDTFCVILGYFILFSSTKAEGRVKTLGQALAIWAFIIAGFISLAGAYVTSTGLCSMDMMGECWNRGGA